MKNGHDGLHPGPEPVARVPGRHPGHRGRNGTGRPPSGMRRMRRLRRSLLAVREPPEPAPRSGAPGTSRKSPCGGRDGGSGRTPGFRPRRGGCGQAVSIPFPDPHRGGRGRPVVRLRLLVPAEPSNAVPHPASPPAFPPKDGTSTSSRPMAAKKDAVKSPPSGIRSPRGTEDGQGSGSPGAEAPNLDSGGPPVGAGASREHGLRADRTGRPVPRTDGRSGGGGRRESPRTVFEAPPSPSASCRMGGTSSWT